MSLVKKGNKWWINEAIKAVTSSLISRNYLCSFSEKSHNITSTFYILFFLIYNVYFMKDHRLFLSHSLSL